jgi:hypothetical protein
MSRSRRSRGEWARLIAVWRSSGQTAESFARAHRLNSRTFAWWRSRLGQVPAASSESAVRPPDSLTFVRVGSASPAEAVGPLEVLEVVLSGELSVRVPASMGAARVAELVHALRVRRA